MGKFKEAYLAYLKQQGLRIAYAFGNTLTDIRCYEESGISKENTYIVGRFAGRGGTRPVSSFRDILAELNELPDAEVGVDWVSMDW